MIGVENGNMVNGRNIKTRGRGKRQIERERWGGGGGGGGRGVKEQGIQERRKKKLENSKIYRIRRILCQY